MKYFGELLGSTKNFESSQGGPQKPFELHMLYLKYACQYLWHNHVIGVGHENCQRFRDWAVKMFHTFKGDMKLFTHWFGPWELSMHSRVGPVNVPCIC